jgi:ribosomal protein S8E
VRGGGFNVAGAAEKERIKSADKVNLSAVALGLVKSTDIFIVKNKKRKTVLSVKTAFLQKSEIKFPFLVENKS